MTAPDITFVLPGLVQSGGARAVLEIADHLRRRGSETLVVVPERTLLAPRRTPVGALQRHLPAALVPLVQPFASRRCIEQTWFELQTPLRGVGRITAELPPTGVVVATSYRTAEEIMRDPRLAARSVYFVQHDEGWSGSRHRVDATWRAFDRLIVTAPWLRRRAVEDFGKADVGLVVYGADPRTFFPAHEGPAQRDLPVVGFMWDDRAWKGGADMLAVLDRLRQPHRASAFGLGDPAALPDGVEAAGRLSGTALADFYRSVDVFVSASHSDAGPMMVPEAMACRVPVVATDIGCVRIWSRDGEACRLAAPGDVGALAEATDALLVDRRERARLGEIGCEAIAPFTWERSALAFEEALLAFDLPVGRRA